MLRLWRESCAFRGCLVSLAAVLLLAGGSWLYLDWKMQRDLETTVARLERKGCPMSAAALAPGPVSDDENAAVLYQQVFRVDFEDPRSTESVFEQSGGAIDGLSALARAVEHQRPHLDHLMGPASVRG